jgi:hypothetical protein
MQIRDENGEEEKCRSPYLVGKAEWRHVEGFLESLLRLTGEDSLLQPHTPYYDRVLHKSTDNWHPRCKRTVASLFEIRHRSVS